MIKQILKWCKISSKGSDADQFPVQQITHLGKASDAYILFPFGMHANADPESLGLLHLIQGDQNAKAVLPLDPDNRPKPLAGGEVAFYHPSTGSIIHFKSNGDLDINTVKKATGSINITTEKLTVNANVSVTIDAPETTVTGNLTVNGNSQVDGNQTVIGNTVLGATVTSGGKNISLTHTHAGSPTAPAGPVSNTGVVN